MCIETETAILSGAGKTQLYITVVATDNIVLIHTNYEKGGAMLYPLAVLGGTRTSGFQLEKGDQD